MAVVDPNQSYADSFNNLLMSVANDPRTGASTPVASSDQRQSGLTASGATAGYNAQPGYGYDLLDRAAKEEEFMNNLTAQHQKERDQLLQSFNAYNTETDNALKLKMQQGLITNEQYQQARSLAQQEAEFSRTLAEKQLTDQHDYEIQRATEMRQERAQQAQLAANPTDWVAYQFYNRGLGNPGGTPAPTGSQILGGASPSSGTGAAAGGGVVPSSGASGGGSMIGGGEYSPATPGYSNSSMQSLATSLFNNSGAQSWNPGLSGQGAFGTQIAAPNSISRSTMNSMTPTEQSLLTGLLKAGININGQQVAINPDDFFKQQQQSQIPTLQEGIDRMSSYGMPQYT